jgi:hypothetical protein
VKLRLDGKSIRLRLSASEVSRLANEGEVSTPTMFPGGNELTARLRTADVPTATAAFDAGTILITMPTAQAKEWAASEQIGVYGESEKLRIVVEKDLRDSCE